MYVAMFLAGVLTCHLLYSVAGYIMRARATYDPADEVAMEQGILNYRAKALEYTKGGYGCLADSEWSDMHKMQRRLYRLRVAKAVLRINGESQKGGNWPW
jgi:hypothetical protein